MHSQANETVGPESPWQKVRERTGLGGTAPPPLVACISGIEPGPHSLLPGGLPQDLPTQRIGTFSVAPFFALNSLPNQKRKLTFRNLSQGQTACCLLPGGLTEEVALKQSASAILPPATLLPLCCARIKNRFLVRTVLLLGFICIFLQRLKYLCALE